MGDNLSPVNMYNTLSLFAHLRSECMTYQSFSGYYIDFFLSVLLLMYDIILKYTSSCVDSFAPDASHAIVFRKSFSNSLQVEDYVIFRPGLLLTIK